MPPISWPFDAHRTVRAYGTRVQAAEAEALLLWSIWTVESLFYLDDLDAAYDLSRQSTGNHSPDIIDVAHGRWATVSCVTALDLAAAALARVYCSHTGPQEVSVSQLNPRGRSGSPRVRRAQTLRSTMPPLALDWVDALLADVNYATVCSARHSLTHARSPRHFRFEDDGPARLELHIGKTQLALRALVRLARDTAAAHTVSLLSAIQQL